MKEAKIFERHMVTGKDTYQRDKPIITVFQYVPKGEKPDAYPREGLNIELLPDGELVLVIENGSYTGTLQELEEKLIEWATGEYCDPEKEYILFTNPDQDRIVSWKPEVKISETEWGDNALRFATKKEAEDAGRELMSRWMAVLDFRATSTTDPVNYRFDVEKQRPEPIGTVETKKVDPFSEPECTFFSELPTGEYNPVTCGDCGAVMAHLIQNPSGIKCPVCGFEADHCDFPDLHVYVV